MSAKIVITGGINTSHSACWSAFWLLDPRGCVSILVVISNSYYHDDCQLFGVIFNGITLFLLPINYDKQEMKSSFFSRLPEYFMLKFGTHIIQKKRNEECPSHFEIFFNLDKYSSKCT